jgi:hypothetical protein
MLDATKQNLNHKMNTLSVSPFPKKDRQSIHAEVLDEAKSGFTILKDKEPIETSTFHG